MSRCDFSTKFFRDYELLQVQADLCGPSFHSRRSLSDSRPRCHTEARQQSKPSRSRASCCRMMFQLIEFIPVLVSVIYFVNNLAPLLASRLCRTDSPNSLESRGNYRATSNNVNLVNWPLMGGLLHLIQRGGDWARPQPAQFPHCCTKCRLTSINGQCTNHRIAV